MKKDILYINSVDDIRIIDMLRVSKKEEEHDYSKDYLTFEALEDGTFTLSIPANVNSTYMTSVSYSIDNGETWNTTTIDNTAQTIITPTIAAGSKVLWKGVGKQMARLAGSGNYSHFSSTGNFNVSGNIMSLLYGNEFQDKTTFSKDSECNFAYLFSGVTKLVNVKNLILPATILTSSCYAYMFWGCTGFTTPPVFTATTLANQCYSGMFNTCTSLTTAPELPATTLTGGCYSSMFSACNSLNTAPALPATTLTQGCYYNMFRSCRSLTLAPELPATTLESGCYSEMFSGCTRLNYIKAMFTTTPSTTYTQNWVQGVAASGTFVKNSAATWTDTGTNAVPTGWTVETADS